MSSLTTLSVSMLATASQLSGASRGCLTYLPRVQHLAYNAMAHLIAQHLGNEGENTLVELAEMLRNGDLYREAMSSGWKRHLNQKGWVVPSTHVQWTRRMERDETVIALPSILHTFHNQTRTNLISMIVVEGDNSTSVMVIRLRFLPSAPVDALPTPGKPYVPAYGYYVFDPNGHLELFKGPGNDACFIFAQNYIDVLSILQGVFWDPFRQLAERKRPGSPPEATSQLFTTYSAFLPSTAPTPPSPKTGGRSYLLDGLRSSTQSHILESLPQMLIAKSNYPDAAPGATPLPTPEEAERGTASQHSTVTVNRLGSPPDTFVGKYDIGAFSHPAIKSGGSGFEQTAPSRTGPSPLVPLGESSGGGGQSSTCRETSLHPPFTASYFVSDVPETTADVGADEDPLVEPWTNPKLDDPPSTSPTAKLPLRLEFGFNDEENRKAGDLGVPNPVDLLPAMASVVPTQPHHSERYSREDKGKGKAPDSEFDDAERHRIVAKWMEILRDRARSRMHEDLATVSHELGSLRDPFSLAARDGQAAASYDSSEHTPPAIVPHPRSDSDSGASSPALGLPNTEQQVEPVEVDVTPSPLTTGPPSLKDTDTDIWRRLGDRRMQNRRILRETMPIIEVSPPSPTRAPHPEPPIAYREPQPPLVPFRDVDVAQPGFPTGAHHSSGNSAGGSYSAPSSPFGNLLAPLSLLGLEREVEAEAETHSEGLLATLALRRIRRPRSLNFLRHHRSSSASPPVSTHSTAPDSQPAPASGAGVGADSEASASGSGSAGSALGLSRLWHKYSPRSPSLFLTRSSIEHARRASDPGPAPALAPELPPALPEGGDNGNNRGSFDPSLIEALFPGYTATSPDTLKECGICMSDMPPKDMALIPRCKHVFCYPCVRQYVTGRLQDGRLDMPCPSCAAAGPAHASAEQGEVSRDFIEYLALSASEREALERLEMAEFAVLHRCPKCAKSVYIDRQEYMSSKFIDCPLPRCGGRSCKNCAKEVGKVDKNPHICYQDELASYVNSSGAKRCPGCTTLIERNTGCNHMTCIVPACNTHFCYRCMGLIVQSRSATVVREAVKAHYTTCKMFA